MVLCFFYSHSKAGYSSLYTDEVDPSLLRVWQSHMQIPCILQYLVHVFDFTKKNDLHKKLALQNNIASAIL